MITMLERNWLLKRGNITWANYKINPSLSSAEDFEMVYSTATKQSSISKITSNHSNARWLLLTEPSMTNLSGHRTHLRRATTNQSHDSLSTKRIHPRNLQGSVLWKAMNLLPDLRWQLITYQGQRPQLRRTWKIWDRLSRPCSEGDTRKLVFVSLLYILCMNWENAPSRGLGFRV